MAFGIPSEQYMYVYVYAFVIIVLSLSVYRNMVLMANGLGCVSRAVDDDVCVLFVYLWTYLYVHMYMSGKNKSTHHIHYYSNKQLLDFSPQTVSCPLFRPDG